MSEGVVVVAPSAVSRGDRVERRAGPTESRDGWSLAISSKFGGQGLGDGKELLRGGM